MLFVPGPRMILFFFFITSALCSIRLNNFITRLKGENTNHEIILENIVIESLKVKYDFSSNSTIFVPAITKMGIELEKPWHEAHNLLFFAFADYIKKLCIDSISKYSRGLITSEDFLITYSNIGYFVIEAGVINIKNADLRIPDGYIITFLRTVNTLSRHTDCNISIFMGLVQYCHTDSCFNVFSSIYLEGLKAGTFVFSVFFTNAHLTETAAFDRFIQTIFDLNQNGENDKYPSLIIAKIIYNGPISAESLRIFLRLFDENVARELSNDKCYYTLVSHKLSVCGLFDQFISLFNSFNYRRLEKIVKMKEDMELKNSKYQIIQSISNANIRELNLDGLIEFKKYIYANYDTLKYYNEQLPIYSFDYVMKINSKIVELFTLASETNVPFLKKSYMKIVLALISFTPKNIIRQFSMISFDPLYDYLLDKTISESDFTPSELLTVRKSITSAHVKVTRAALTNYTKVFVKFKFIESISYDVALITIVISNTKDGYSTVSKFKLVHQFSEAMEIDWTQSSSLLLSQLTHLDPVYFRDWVSYCAAFNLLSKTTYLLAMKFIKSLQI